LALPLRHPRADARVPLLVLGAGTTRPGDERKRGVAVGRSRAPLLTIPVALPAALDRSDLRLCMLLRSVRPACRLRATAATAAAAAAAAAAASLSAPAVASGMREAGGGGGGGGRQREEPDAPLVGPRLGDPEGVQPRVAVRQRAAIGAALTVQVQLGLRSRLLR
jgi:hypothetical protein